MDDTVTDIAVTEFKGSFHNSNYTFEATWVGI